MNMYLEDGTYFVPLSLVGGGGLKPDQLGFFCFITLVPLSLVGGGGLKPKHTYKTKTVGVPLSLVGGGGLKPQIAMHNWIVWFHSH